MTRALLLLALSASAFGCSRTGQITQPTAADANVPYTFTGTPNCQPKVILFFYNNATGNGGIATAAWGFGAAASTSQRFASFAIAQDNVATSNTDRYVSQSLVIAVISNAGTVIASADLLSFNANGFSLNWGVADATARIINYLAIGGADVANVEIGSYTGSGSPQEINLAGAFQPDLLIEYFGGAVGAVVGITQAWGFVTATDKQTIQLSVADAQANSISRTKLRTDRGFGAMNSSGTAITDCATVALDADGFTSTCATQGGVLTQYIAIKGGSYKIGTFDAPTTDGNADITGIGFTPKAILLMGWNSIPSTSIINDANVAIGAATSSTNRWSIWFGDDDGQTTMVANSYLNNATVFNLRFPATGGAPTAVASADFVAFGSGTATLNWDGDATGRQVLYLAISTSEAAASTVIPRRVIKQ